MRRAFLAFSIEALALVPWLGRWLGNRCCVQCLAKPEGDAAYRSWVVSSVGLDHLMHARHEVPQPTLCGHIRPLVVPSPGWRVFFSLSVLKRSVVLLAALLPNLTPFIRT